MGAVDGGHAVTIVGWDDNYDRNKFTTQPPDNGAFIAKNSWNTSWGEEGYFYISYYDSVFATDCAVFTAEPADNYDHIYQYDPLGWTINLNASGSDVAWFRNDFTIVSDERLEAVGFLTASRSTQRTIYTSMMGSSLVLPRSVSIAHPWAITLTTHEPVKFNNGEKMSIVVRVNGPDPLYTH